MDGHQPYVWWMAFNQVKGLPEKLLESCFQHLLDYLFAYVTQVADYRPTWLKVWAKMKRTIFSANPAAVTA
jgi:hypothetical protein